MYFVLFVITQDPYENPYLVTKLVPLILEYTVAPFDINITGPFTPSALPTGRNVIENLESL